MSDKSYSEMTDDELCSEMLVWVKHVDNSSGWPSAYFAAKQCQLIEREGARRGVKIENPRPIRAGGSDE